MIDLPTSYLHFESGLADKDFFIHIYYFSWTVLDRQTYAMTEGFKILSNLKISYEFWKIWSNYG